MAYFFSKIFTLNDENWFVHVEVVAKSSDIS